MSKQKGFWKVGHWHSGPDAALAFGAGNDANGVVILGLAEAADFEDRPIVVKRIVGQYNVVRLSTPPVALSYIQHRVAMGRTDITAGTVTAGDLLDADDAEDNWLWNETNVISPTNTTSGMIPLGTTSARVLPQRWGSFDIRVARRVDNLLTLYWQSQAAVAAIDEYAVHLWCRLWCQEVG